MGTEEKQKIETKLDAVFNHIYDVAEKMGDSEIDSLLKPDTVKEWEQLLADTEEGKINYKDAVDKMEAILTKEPAALKLAEATKAFVLVEEDGGNKGVTEITNFRSLLRHVKWLPQYASVLELLSDWKDDKITMQHAMTTIQEQTQAGEIDPRWLSEAMKAPTAPSDKTANAAKTTVTAAAKTTASAKATATAATSENKNKRIPAAEPFKRSL